MLSRWLLLSLVVGTAGLVTRSAALAGPPGKTPGKELGAIVRLRGKLRVARGVSKKRLLLTASDGRVYRLVGPLHHELQRLNNHHLEVHGRLDTQSKKRSFDVSRYTIVEVSGKRPQLGWLLVRPGGAIYLQQRERNLTVTGSKAFIKRMKKRLGCKVWVVGTLTEKTLKAVKYGWINCTGRTPIRQPKKEK